MISRDDKIDALVNHIESLAWIRVQHAADSMAVRVKDLEKFQTALAALARLARAAKETDK